MIGPSIQKIEGGARLHPKYTPSHYHLHTYIMGFDAFIQVTIHFKNGRPYFYRTNYEEVYDLTQIPMIPEEFREFETLRGHSWRALLDGDKKYTDHITEIGVKDIFPDYVKMCKHDSYEEDDFTEEDVEKFKTFCDWVRGTGVNYTYSMSW